MKRSVITAVLGTLLLSACASPPRKSANHSSDFWHEELPAAVAERMQKNSWKEGCPVPLKDLRLLHVSYVTPSGDIRQGLLVVHHQLADETLDIFRELLAKRFPIARMDLIDEFNGSDDRSMEVNNSSAFNCRMNITTGNTFSMHAYGFAIDVNPLVNPYTKPAVDLNGLAVGPITSSRIPVRVEPPAGKAYLNRHRPVPGMILEGDACYEAFVKRGWTWGGHFHGRTDYQHFEKKPAGF